MRSWLSCGDRAKEMVKGKVVVNEMWTYLY